MKLTIPFTLPLEVDFTYHKASKGARDSLMGIPGAGAPLEPDEPEHVEINAVRHNGVLVRLSEDDLEQLEEHTLIEFADLNNQPKDTREEEDR